jgi:uncharacterized protein YecE (DUF72 family)
MSEAKIRLGTSSWNAEGWVGSFYPANSKPQDFLPLYAQSLGSVEIDSTFYRIPSARTVQQWNDRTPDGFTFAAKIPQLITHEKMLVDVDDDLTAFVKVMDLLGEKLGRLLFQFPYFNKQKFRGVGFFLERLEPFVERLPKDHQWVVEVRNRTWLSEKLYTVLRRHRVALALVDHAWMPRPSELFETGDPITADFTFVRWIGDRKGIEERTKVWNRTLIDRTEDMREWVKILSAVSRRVRIIFAFSNNHYAGYAPDTVELFKRLWSQQQSVAASPADKRSGGNGGTAKNQPRLPGL